MLDTLRGMAIFGILMVNMQIFFQPMVSMINGHAAYDTTMELLSGVFIKFFFEGKFYVLFSMLFGYGFYLFMNKETTGGKSIIPVYRRRVFFLLLFGVLHVVLLWPGDILVFYALFGFLLLLFRHKKDRSLIKWALWLALVPVAAVGGSALLIQLARLAPDGGQQAMATMQQSVVQMEAMADRAAAVYASGSFAEVTVMRMEEYLALLPGMIFFYPMVLAMFLVGLLAARRGLLKNYHQHLPFFRGAARWGLVLGGLFSALFVYGFLNSQRQIPDLLSTLSSLGSIVGGFFFSLFYVSTVVLLFARGKASVLQRLFAPVGRMALTNYILQSVICTTLFYGYGFGWFGKITLGEGILLTLAIFALQIPFSSFWLRHFHYGPLEWLWRSLTYMKPQPFLKKDVDILRPAPL